MPVICYRIHLLYSMKEFSDGCFVEKRHTQDAKYIESTSFKTKVMLDYGDKTIHRNCSINLNSDSCFSNAPKGFNVQMLLDPFKEQFYLPSVFIQQSNMFSLDIEVVGQVSERSFVLHRVISDTSKEDGIFFHGLLSRKSYSLIIDDIVRRIKKVFTFNDFVLKFTSFPDDKIGSDYIYFKKSRQVKISSVKDIVGIRFIRDCIHSIHVMNLSLGNMKKSRNLSDYIVKRVHLNSPFCFAKACPPEKAQTQINGSGIKGIESPSNLKVFSNTLFLSDSYHLIGKFLKNLEFSVCVGLGKVTAGYHRLAESKMISLGSVSRYNTNQFSKTFATSKLTEHHNQQLIPTAERFNVFVTLVLHNDTLKCLLWKKLDKLCKYIFPAVHNSFLLLNSKVKIQIVDTENRLYIA